MVRLNFFVYVAIINYQVVIVKNEITERILNILFIPILFLVKVSFKIYIYNNNN